MKHIEIRGISNNIRALRAQRDLIEKAAAVRQKTRSDSMLETACHEAENILLETRLFSLKDNDYEAFDVTLKGPVRDNPELRKLLAKRVPWNKEKKCTELFFIEEIRVSEW